MRKVLRRRMVMMTGRRSGEYATCTEVVDIYIGGKNDRSGSTFAFVRFENIRDAKVLEHEMSRVRCGHYILRVNIARYQKRQGPKGFKINTNHVVPPEKSYQVAWKATNATRDSRTFAEVIKGTTSRPLASGTNPIAINPATFSVGMEDCVMVGEIISIQQITDLPTVLPFDGNPRWYGLPVRFRSNENFSRIANAFGTTLEIIGVDWKAFDISTGEVCIITKHNTIINNVVNVSFRNKVYPIGIVEYDRDWMPFDRSIQKDPIPQVNDDIDDEAEDDMEVNDSKGDKGDKQDFEEDENQDSEEDAISDTWMGPVQQDDVLEDGEIIEESGEYVAPETVALISEDLENPQVGLSVEDPLAVINTSVPPFDLNTSTAESNSKEDHSVDDIGSSSCELTKIVKVGCDVGFQFSKDDLIVTRIANLGDDVKMKT
ncbi:unnamed protein product [Lactuca saligna]|uniref:RRM domain-containing protein n=1 Tax=Lactuca saligna TaxID=75948 RepID=A0AA36A2G7_LACSI|nr:unnamed protein product [Lactuca saligna]